LVGTWIEFEIAYDVHVSLDAAAATAFGAG
jgi:hypothetical protein